MSKMKRINGRFALAVIWAALTGISLFAGTPSAMADDHGFRHREFMDSRYHHNHYYPARGGYISVLPRGHRVVVFGRDRYFFSGGVWYRPWGARFVVVAPPIGLVIPSLPPYYTLVYVGGVPYYYANEVYYLQSPGGYTVVSPPQGDVATTPASPTSMPQSLPIAEMTFIYPRQGQNEKQQATDRYECHRWAVGQTGYDPTQPPAGLSDAQGSQKRTDYRKAQAACLEGRGYAVK